MSRLLAAVWSVLKEVAMAGVWMSPVTPPELYVLRPVSRRGFRPVPGSPATGPVPGHPERLTDAAPTPAERRIWAELKELTP